MRRVLGSLVVLASLPGQTRIPFLPARQIEARRDRAIRRMVQHAARSVPHYREYFARERIDPRDIRGARELDALPTLSREEVRRHPRRFLSETIGRSQALPLLTSGTTGTPLEIHHDQRSLLQNIAFGERERAPVIQLASAGFRPRELHIGYETSNFRKVLGFYASHARMPKPRRTAISMTASFDEIVAAVNDVRPDILTAYGGFLDVFYRTAAARQVSLHRPKVVMYVGETLAPERRDWIERELGAAVMSRYCAVEAFKIGYFCEARTGFHLHDDLCHVRIVRRDGTSADVGELGEIVISNLVNRATVLLNYPMGDIGVLAAGACRCGRGHRLLSDIHGRLEDMLPLADGRHLHPRAVWAIFKDDRDVLQYQLIQLELRHFALRLVTANAAAFATAGERARAALMRLLGEDALIEVTPADDLGRDERAATGKFRAVESRLSRHEVPSPSGP